VHYTCAMTDLLTWLQYPELLEWLAPLIFAIALLESLFLVGLALPGVAMLATAAWLAGQQQMPIPQLLVLGWAGAVSGDAISFYLGRHWAQPIYRHSLFQRHPHWQSRGEAFFQRYGPFSLLLGRFVGPVRPFIPFIAGSLQLKPVTFWGVNAVSALLWAPFYLLPGYWLGQQSELLSGRYDLLLQILAGLALLLLIGYGLHHQLQPERSLHRRLSPLPAPVGASVLGSMALTALLGLMALRQFVPVLDSELQLHAWLSALPTMLYPLAVVITSLGDLPVAGAILVMVSGLLVIKGRRRSALVFSLLLIAVVVINHLLKESFSWPRPDTGADLYRSWSFPSGHASTGAAVFAMLAILVSERLSETVRRMLYGALALPVLLIPLSRTLLDLHWPLDVVAGLCEGLVVAALWRHWQARHPIAFRASERLGLLAAVGIILVGYLYWRVPTALLFYQSAGAS